MPNDCEVCAHELRRTEELLGKYALHVEYSEGVSFAEPSQIRGPFTEVDAARVRSAMRRYMTQNPQAYGPASDADYV